MTRERIYKVKAKIFKWNGPEKTTDTSRFRRNLSGTKFSRPLANYDRNSTREVGAWFFVRIEKETAEIIKDNFGMFAAGWGSLPVNVTLGNSTWKTSIFPDKKETYLLPIKSQIRKAENIKEGDELKIKLEVIAETTQIPAPPIQ